MFNVRERFKAAGIHFGISLGIAALSALLVFGLWYPYPYREISGGRELFLIVVTVDVILGPLITFAIFNRRKPWRELRRDLVVVGLIQLAGLGYGLWTVAVARPVHLVFEIDRFRVVHAVDVPEDLMDKVPAGVQAMPWTGPTLLSVRQFWNDKERVDATLAALQGIALGARPDLWQAYAAARKDVQEVAQPLAKLKARFPSRVAEIESVAQASGRAAETVIWLPMVGRKSYWTVLLDARTTEVLGFLALDSF